jgi:hypothetical protein
MKSVWKFPLAVTDAQTIEMPIGARLLTVQPQGDQVCLWALVETTAMKERRYIAILGTGHEAPSRGDLKYIGTFQLNKGALVFHAFEIVNALV